MKIQILKKFRKGLALSILIGLCVMPSAVAAKEAVCEVMLPICVETTGDTAEKPAEFEFLLTSEDAEAPMPESVVCRIQGDGSVTFGPITYTMPEDYHYTVVQKKGQDEQWIYDDAVYEVTVRVTYNEAGALVPEIWAVKSEMTAKSDTLLFINHYDAPQRPTVITNTPQTGDSANLTAAWFVMAAAVCVMAVIGHRYKHRTK